MIFYTYVCIEQIRILVIISLILNKFSNGKAQIPHFFKASHYSGAVSMDVAFFHTALCKERKSLLEVV